MNIAKLKLSNSSRNFLLQNGYTTTESLMHEDFFSLSEKFGIFEVFYLVRELNRHGYLFPANAEKTIYDYEMSTRLRNALIKIPILYLSQLKFYTQEQALHFRNIGKSTIVELDTLCATHHFAYYTMPELPTIIKNNRMIYSDLVTIFAKGQLKSFDDFLSLPLSEIYHLVNCNYWLISKIYYLLQKSNYLLVPSDSYFIFEFFPQKYVKSFSQYNLFYMHDLLDKNKESLNWFCQKYKLNLSIIQMHLDDFRLHTFINSKTI